MWKLQSAVICQANGSNYILMMLFSFENLSDLPFTSTLHFHTEMNK